MLKGFLRYVSCCAVDKNNTQKCRLCVEIHQGGGGTGKDSNNRE